MCKEGEAIFFAIQFIPIVLSLGFIVQPFVSSYTNKIDKKGRVSVPAAFRAIVSQDGLNQIFCYNALDVPAIEAGGAALVGKIDQLLGNLPPYSEERDILSTALFGLSENLKIDNDGRIILPEALRDAAKITNFVTFVGMGDKFRIWSPEIFDDYLVEAQKKAIEHRKLFSNRPAD